MVATNIRVTPRALLGKIRDAASSSSNIVFIPSPEKRSMAGMMTYRQALECLRSGKIMGTPQLNEHGHWELRMERYAANFLFSTRVVAVCEGANVVQLIVLLDPTEGI